jgi:hypothetical protein
MNKLDIKIGMPVIYKRKHHDYTGALEGQIGHVLRIVDNGISVRVAFNIIGEPEYKNWGCRPENLEPVECANE